MKLNKRRKNLKLNPKVLKILIILESDKDSTQVVFRAPNGTSRITRRFMKTDLVDNLYEYIQICDFEGLGFENTLNPDFVIMQNMPTKYFNDDTRQLTLEKTGLHPRAMLFIKEK